MAETGQVRDAAHFVLELDATEVDVFQLAPALSALGELVREANRTLYPNEAEISVNVRPFEQGSFLVDFAMYVDQGAAAGLLAALGPDALSKITRLLQVLGLIRGGVTSVLDAIRRLGGPAKNVTALPNQEFRYEADNNVINVNAPVHTLLQNPVVHQHFYQYTRPLESPGVTEERTFLRGHEDTSAVTLRKPDAEIIRRSATIVSRPRHRLPKVSSLPFV